MVECERAKLATGVRFSFTAPHEPDLWVEASVCKTGLPGSIPGRLSNHTFSLSALDAQRRGGCLLNSSERVRLPPRALSPTHQLFPSTIWCGRLALNQEARVRFPLGTPGRSAGLRSLSRARAPAAEPTNTPPVLAARYRATNAAIEVQLLAGGPFASVLVAPGASLRSLMSRFDSWQRRRGKFRGERWNARRSVKPTPSWLHGFDSQAPHHVLLLHRHIIAGRDGPTRGSYPRPRRFDSCPCLRGASWRGAALIRLTSRVRFPPSRPSGCGSIW